MEIPEKRPFIKIHELSRKPTIITCWGCCTNKNNFQRCQAHGKWQVE